MTPMLSIDPGGESCGWVLVDRQQARVRYVTGGQCASTPKALHELMDLVGKMTGPDWDILAMAIEVVEGAVFQPFRAPTLFTTARVVGRLELLAYDNGIPVIPRTAAQVRKALVGKATSPKHGLMDKLIADAVRANVIAWPKESNVHLRDAAALSIIANWELVARRVA